MTLLHSHDKLEVMIERFKKIWVYQLASRNKTFNLFLLIFDSTSHSPFFLMLFHCRKVHQPCLRVTFAQNKNLTASHMILLNYRVTKTHSMQFSKLLLELHTLCPILPHIKTQHVSWQTHECRDINSKRERLDSLFNAFRMRAHMKLPLVVTYFEIPKGFMLAKKFT